MTQIELVNAYKALSHLAVQTLPLKAAYGIHKLRRALLPAWEFQVAQEQALIERYGGEVDGSTIRFGDPHDPGVVERAKAYTEAINDLNALEADYDPQPPVRMALTNDIVLSANEIDALDGFVTFEGGE